jgi:Tol biopolymer transport system component
MNADGTGASRLTSNNLGDSQPSWSPDGKKIAFTARTAPNQYAVFLINADGSGRTRFTEDFDMVGDPSWSPDGQQIAFTATVTNCGWYYYYDCYSQITIVGINGSRFLFPFAGSAEAAWRPR